MTTLFPQDKRCAVCGGTSTQNAIGSTSAFGSPDLDLRPSGMQRGTIPFWLERCPHCGYVATDLAEDTPVTKEWLAEEAYQTCGDIPFQSELAKTFYRRHLLAEKMGDAVSAFFAALNAAWAADDKHDTEAAICCRKLALSCHDACLAASPVQRDSLLVMKADLLRRSGQHQALLAEYGQMHFSHPLLQQIIDFQLKKAREEDVACYTVEDAACGQ